MTRDEIKNIALDIGFELKEQPDGKMDLNEYVYYFAEVIAKKALAKHKSEQV